MNKISIGKLFELYCDIFEKFGTHILVESDAMIGYYVFEQNVVNIGFCSNRILNYLLMEGLIDGNIKEKSSLLLTKFWALEKTNFWNVKSIRTSPEWNEVMELSDEIKQLIKARWDDEELQAIFDIEKENELSGD